MTAAGGSVAGPAESVASNRLKVPLQAEFARISGAWRAVTEPYVGSEAGSRLCQFVDQRVAAGVAVYPAHVFRALELVAPEDVRVVILGQDPYHGAGQAQGLAFSVAPGQKVPPSLRNMLKEVRSDTGEASQCKDDLTPWARQGVLLLNSVLTVEDGAPQSHAARGWEALTDALLAEVGAKDRPVVFMLWGASAQKKRSLLTGGNHCVLASNHPSPLSAGRPPVPFVGARPFSQANEFLLRHDRGPAIRW